MVKQIKGVTSNTVEFGKRLAQFVGTVITVAPSAAGVYTALYGRGHHLYVISATGAFTTICGLVIVYRWTMRTKKEA